MPSKSINDLSIVSAVDSTNAYIIVETSSGTKRISVDALINSSNAVDTKPTTGYGTFNSINGGTISLTDAFATSSSTTITLIRNPSKQGTTFLGHESSVTLFKPAGSTTIHGPSGSFAVGSEAEISLGTSWVKYTGHSKGNRSSAGSHRVKLSISKDSFSILTIKNNWGQNIGTNDPIFVLIQAFK